MDKCKEAIKMVEYAMRCKVATPEQAEKKALLPTILEALRAQAEWEDLVPYLIGSTVYHSDPYFCQEGEAVACEVISYSISRHGSAVRCFINWHGFVNFNPCDLYATAEEAIANRRANERKTI